MPIKVPKNLTLEPPRQLLCASEDTAGVGEWSNPTALRNSCFNHRGSRRAQFQQKIPRNFRSLPVTGRVPQRLKPGVENQSEWLASYAEVFAPTRHRLRSRPWVMRTVCFPPSPHTPPQNRSSIGLIWSGTSSGERCPEPIVWPVIRFGHIFRKRFTSPIGAAAPI